MHLVSQLRNDISYVPEEYLEDQCSYAKALSTFERELNVASQKEIDVQLKQVKDPDMKLKWQKHFDAQQNKAIKEACLHHVAGVKELAWVPVDCRNPRLIDPTTKRLLGTYVLNVCKLNLRDDGDSDNVPTFEVHPDSSWVEQNFDPYYLATAQKIAIDYWEQISPVDQRHPAQWCGSRSGFPRRCTGGAGHRRCR